MRFIRARARAHSLRGNIFLDKFLPSNLPSLLDDFLIPAVVCAVLVPAFVLAFSRSRLEAALCVVSRAVSPRKVFPIRRPLSFFHATLRFSRGALIFGHQRRSADAKSARIRNFRANLLSARAPRVIASAQIAAAATGHASKVRPAGPWVKCK